MTDEEIRAAANAAFWAMVNEAGDNWMGFDHSRDAYEGGWEDGYRAALNAARPFLVVDRDDDVWHRTGDDEYTWAGSMHLTLAELTSEYGPFLEVRR